MGGGGSFVVLTTQRNGSTWVMSVLNGVEGVTGQGELFLARPRVAELRWDSDFAYPRYVEARGEVGRVRPLSVFRYLDRFYGQPGLVGFKLMYDQLRAYPETLAYLVLRRVAVVHLVRRNHLDVLISSAVKRELGRAHVLSEAQRPTEVRVELTADRLVDDLERLERKHALARTLLRLARLRHIQVAYEDLATDPDLFARVLDFLGVSDADGVPQSGILKSRVGSQRDVLANYDEVKRALQGSRFAALLDAS